MKRYSCLSFVILLFLFTSPSSSGEPTSFAFVAVGDTGCDCDGQLEIARRMFKWYDEKPYQIVLMLGDNIYARDYNRSGGSRALFEERFDKYYKPLIARGVKFYAVLGNHDVETNDGRDEIADKQRFNILGNRGYYSFTPEVKVDETPLVTFYALNSSNLDKREDANQVAWLSRALTEDKSLWKIPFFHHPFYSPPGGHEEPSRLRSEMEAILIAAGVRLTLAGHNHFYARMKPRKGVIHFTSGGGGRKLVTPRADESTAESAKVFHFLYMEVYPDNINFWAVPGSGPPIDYGAIARTGP